MTNQPKLCGNLIQITLPGGRFMKGSTSIHRCAGAPGHEGQHGDGHLEWSELRRPATAEPDVKPATATDGEHPQIEHLFEHVAQQPGDCALARDLRSLLNDAVNLGMSDRDELSQLRATVDRIRIEVDGWNSTYHHLKTAVHRALRDPWPWPKTPRPPATDPDGTTAGA